MGPKGLVLISTALPGADRAQRGQGPSLGVGDLLRWVHAPQELLSLGEKVPLCIGPKDLIAGGATTSPSFGPSGNNFHNCQSKVMATRKGQCGK